MLNFQPTLVLGELLVELPRPIVVCRIQDSWDFLTLKVPFRDGDQVAGPSRDGAEVVIEGRIGSQSGDLKLSEEAMLLALLELRTALHDVTEEGFKLALYRDSLSAEYHYFERCRTSRLDIDLSDNHLYSYAVMIHASDPAVHVSTLP